MAKRAGFIDAVKEKITGDGAQEMNINPDYGNQLIEKLIDGLPNPEKREELREARKKLREYIVYYVHKVVGEFAGEVNIWRLANEFDINPQAWWDPYFYLIGPDYPDLIFKAAREADPTAKLIINPAPGDPEDTYFYNITVPVIQRLKQKGIIDGVGDQAHEDASQPYDWKKRFDRDWGVEVVITERDVYLGNIPVDNRERFNLQAERYATSFKERLDHGVKIFTMWESFGDKDSWLERVPGSNPNADPTLFNDDGAPKPAYFAVRKVLLEKLAQK